MWTSSAVRYISLFCMYHASYFPTFIFTSYVPCFPFFLIDHNQNYMLLIEWIIFFLKLKNVFCSFQLFEKVYTYNIVSTLINSTLKLDVENNSTTNNTTDVYVETSNVDLTLFNVVNFNVDINNFVSTLIWHCPTSQRHITLTTILRPHWNVPWILNNIAKRLHNFVKFVKFKTYIFSRIPLNCCFCKFLKRY